MDLYLVLLLVSCVVCAAIGTAILAADGRQRANRLSAAIVYGGSFWAFCEVLWHSSDDPRVVLGLVKLSALGWVATGPLALHLILDLTGQPAPRLRKLLRPLYGCAALFLAVDWTTDWIHSGVVLTSWGWGYELGPWYPAFLAITVSAIGLALVLGAKAYRRWPSAAERRQARGVGIGILCPLVVASLTDGILPFFGVQVPHLATISIAGLGMTVAWSFYRHGHSLLAPGNFATEILETLPDGLALLHPDGRLRRANPRLLEMAGCEFSGLLGRPMQELLDGEAIDPAWRAHACRFVPDRGRPFAVAVSASVLRDREGSRTGLVLAVRDEREVVALRQRLLISGRMAAVGQLAAGVAHEINNPMAYVGSNLRLLQQHWQAVASQGDAGIPMDEARVELLAEGRELLDECLEGVGRATEIVKDIKGFSHAGEAGRQDVDLNELVSTEVRIASIQIRGHVKIDTQWGDLPLVRCAAREIEQVLLNLILNAVDDSPQGTTVWIATRCEESSVLATVRDEGSGIEIEDLERIFDPFFTTKAAGEGTGLGLALSYEIARRHQGDIQVESRPGRGSCFSLLLPAA